MESFELELMTHYRKALTELRNVFPQPVSDPVHDAYMVFSILRVLDQVDGLKSDKPILGRPAAPDWSKARMSRIAPDGRTLEQVVGELVDYLEGMFIWGHPRCQVQVVGPPSIASIIGVLLPAVYNPNLCSEETSCRIAEAEVRTTAMVAALVGYDPDRAAGMFTFGGTGALFYGVKVGLEKAVPGCMKSGLTEPSVVLASSEAHYCALTVAGWLGIGQDHVIRVTTQDDNALSVEALEDTARSVLAENKKIAAFVATIGTTDAFGLDDLAAMHAMRQRLVDDFSLPYVPHLHADAAIGWAWSVFNDYDFDKNDLGFHGRTIRALAATQYQIRHLHLADSISIDFHKTGYTPYVCSLVLFSDRGDLELIARDRQTMPYLYQSGEYHPGTVTLETSRSGAGPMAALANLLLFGTKGLRVLLGHSLEMAEVLREGIASHPNLTVLNDQNVGPVTVFRAYPSGVDTFTAKEREYTDERFREQLGVYNQFNRQIFERVHAEALAGRGVAIAVTDCYRRTDYGEPIVGLKTYILSPFADETEMRQIIDHVLAAAAQIEDEAKLR